MEMNNCNKNNKDTDMTSEDDQDEKLPEVLQRLEIVPLMPMIKLRDDKLPLLLNPFYIEGNNQDMKNNNADTLKLFGTKCKCLGRKYNNNNNNGIEHNIINQTRFKHKNLSNSRRIYLKESLLKSIRNCCSIHSTTIPTTTTTTTTIATTRTVAKSSILEFSDYPTLEDLRLEDDCIKSIQVSNSKERNSINYRIIIKDFDLISPYCNLSSQSSSSFAGHFKNFTTLQSSDDRIVKNSRKSLLDDETKNVSKNSNSNMIDTMQQNSNNSNISSSTSTSTSSSCSQQARNNSNSSTTVTATQVSCDITIDELASYFETFVHIPKKMSSMAEMMYI